MRNYLRENIERYRRMAHAGDPADCDDFSSCGFLDAVIPRLPCTESAPGSWNGVRGSARARSTWPSAGSPCPPCPPCDGNEQIDGSIHVNGSWYSPFHRYRTGPRLRAEVEGYGFKVLHQSGELGQHLVAVHRESGVGLAQ